MHRTRAPRTLVEARDEDGDCFDCQARVDRKVPAGYLHVHNALPHLHYPGTMVPLADMVLHKSCPELGVRRLVKVMYPGYVVELALSLDPLGPTRCGTHVPGTHPLHQGVEGGDTLLPAD